jgi:hypothetical protein
MAFRSMLAYLGKYHTAGDEVIIKVDIAWTGGEQVRFNRIEGTRLHIEAAPQPYANFGGRVMRGILIWAREQWRSGWDRTLRLTSPASRR